MPVCRNHVPRFPVPTTLTPLEHDMPPVPAPVIIVGGVLAAAAAGYIVYKAYQATQHAQAQEAAKQDGLLDAGVPQTLSE